ncbi:complement component C7 [Ambystoma mexicanum]|uniref:complement component C7 n=1 Tax=Ambystoma mexicanum TaxID=8296 RepID=UPI0037E8F642
MKVLEAILLLQVSGFCQVFSSSPVNCVWNTYGAWSECDGCTNTQTRRRTVAVYSQFGGFPCTGSAFETQPCVPTRGCPLEDGCGERFRCFSGHCISKSLVCNGDHDCEERSTDEEQCEEREPACDIDKIPPNADLTGAGFDIITGEIRSGVIHTKSFGGKCRKVFNGDTRQYYRLSDSALMYTFQVEVKNDFSYEFYNSSWSYLKNSEEHVRTNYRERSDRSTTNSDKKDKSYHFMVIQNDVEVAQFMNNAPEFLTLAESFWKDLTNLPAFYEYSAYRKLIEKYGTHFLHSGSLGGQYKVMFYMDTEKMQQEGMSKYEMEKCTSSSSGFLFWKKKTTECKKLEQLLRWSSGSSSQIIRGDPMVIGGESKFVAGLSYLDLNNPAGNDERYAMWAGSVKNLPRVIKQKVAPLYELVKEVPCDSVKKHFLKKAIEEYVSENNPCKCKPCQNNGQVTIVGTECVCYCKPYTFGNACELGILVQDQPGVIDGSWSCWSSWSPCVRGAGRRTRSRTCNNPYPKGGGKYCNGNSAESQACEDEELEHFRTIEPHCFDSSLTPTTFCPPPPALENGYIKDSVANYPAGTRVVYTCVDGYALIGGSVAQCGEDSKWQFDRMQCQRTVCTSPIFQSDLKSNPKKGFYEIGEEVTLSCPAGTHLEGASTIICGTSLKWSPELKNIQCIKTGLVEPETLAPDCQPWEKLQQSTCVCKMPPECGSSLGICAIDGRNQRNVALTVCKMHALQCLGKKYTVTDDKNCNLPAVTERSCDSCHLWEKCDGQRNKCVCGVGKTCVNGGISICVRKDGETSHQTMSECEAGILRCQGKTVDILHINPCDI